MATPRLAFSVDAARGSVAKRKNCRPLYGHDLPESSAPQRPQQPLGMNGADGRQICFVEGQQQGVFVDVQQVLVGCRVRVLPVSMTPINLG